MLDKIVNIKKIRKKIAKVVRYMPLIHLNIEVPLLRVRTSLMHRFTFQDSYEYMVFSVEVWMLKWWNFSFSLYDNTQRILARKRSDYPGAWHNGE